MLAKITGNPFADPDVFMDVNTTMDELDRLFPDAFTKVVGGGDSVIVEVEPDERDQARGKLVEFLGNPGTNINSEEFWRCGNFEIKLQTTNGFSVPFVPVSNATSSEVSLPGGPVGSFTSQVKGAQVIIEPGFAPDAGGKPLPTPGSLGNMLDAKDRLDNLSVETARSTEIPERAGLVYLSLEENHDPFNEFQEAPENDVYEGAIRVDNEELLEICFCGVTYTDGDADNYNETKITPLEFSETNQRYLIDQLYEGGGPDSRQFIVNVDRKAKTAKVWMRSFANKYSDWKNWSEWKAAATFVAAK